MLASARAIVSMTWTNSDGGASPPPSQRGIIMRNSPASCSAAIDPVVEPAPGLDRGSRFADQRQQFAGARDVIQLGALRIDARIGGSEQLD